MKITQDKKKDKVSRVIFIFFCIKLGNQQWYQGLTYLPYYFGKRFVSICKNCTELLYFCVDCLHKKWGKYLKWKFQDFFFFFLIKLCNQQESQGLTYLSYYFAKMSVSICKSCIEFLYFWVDCLQLSHSL